MVSAHATPKYFSKNFARRSITPRFFSARFPPPNRETGGKIRSISVPVVFSAPSRKELSVNFLASSGFNHFALIISSKSFSFCSWIKLCRSRSTTVSALMVLIKPWISSFLLRSWMLESMARSIAPRISLTQNEGNIYCNFKSIRLSNVKTLMFDIIRFAEYTVIIKRLWR